MVRKSEWPTIPPPFNVDRYARESDAKVAAASAAAPDDEHVAESESRLVTRRPSADTATDEAWAQTIAGSLLLAAPLDELKGMPLDHRAGYLLSCMDGTVGLDTLVELSTLPRAEVVRIVRDLYESRLIALL